MGLGVLLSAVVIDTLPAPRVLPYVVLFVLFTIAFAGAWLMPEPVEDRRRLRLSPQKPSVPPAVRRPFLLASLGVVSSWSVGGLFLSLGPSLSATMFHTSNHLVTGLSVFALAASGAAAQMLFGRSAPWAGAAYGSLALSAGMVLIVLSAAADSAALYWIGAVVGGGGFGVAFLGALRGLSAAISPEHRAAVMSAFYIVAYAAISVPAILAGSVVSAWGLQSTFEIFGSVIAALALIVAFEAWRTRPAPRRLAFAS
jgi:predicted MFS family arabinose efflux permease